MVKTRTSSSIRSKLARGRTTLGSWITLRDPAVAEIMARSGFEWLAVDMEHSPITLSEAAELIRIISLCGTTPLVRLPSNDPVLIKRVLDAGAAGLIVPMVNSSKEAESAVRAAKYPPEGTRGVGISRAQGYGPDFDRYMRAANSDILIVVQIEHATAVAGINGILSTPGIDAFLVGPYDLSGSLGVAGRLSHPKVQKAVSRTLAAGREYGVASGVHVVWPSAEEAQAKARQGFRFIAFGVDFLFLGESCRQGLARIRRGLRA